MAIQFSERGGKILSLNKWFEMLSQWLTILLYQWLKWIFQWLTISLYQWLKWLSHLQYRCSKDWNNYPNLTFSGLPTFPTIGAQWPLSSGSKRVWVMTLRRHKGPHKSWQLWRIRKPRPQCNTNKSRKYSHLYFTLCYWTIFISGVDFLPWIFLVSTRWNVSNLNVSNLNLTGHR